MVKPRRGKCIVITGATRGLGRALTERFIGLGHTVLGCGRSTPAIDALSRQFGPPHDFAVVDVALPDQVEAWCRCLLSSYGPPDFLINNAAVINRNAPLWEVPADEFGQVIDINVKGTANTIRAFGPAMCARRSGVIVNMSSGWGRSTSADVAPYCASKWAIEGLTQALAQELPRGIAAVALNPGIIDTDMLRSTFADSAAHYPGPEKWSAIAAPFILRLTAKDNGRSLSVSA